MPFTADNRKKLDATIAKYPVRRSALLPALRLALEQDGYISPEAMAEIAQILELSTAQVHDTASFYTMFNLKPEGKTLIEVCTTLSCALGGSEGLMNRACATRHQAAEPRRAEVHRQPGRVPGRLRRRPRRAGERRVAGELHRGRPRPGDRQRDRIWPSGPRARAR
jgi:hypothetical protein